MAFVAVAALMCVCCSSKPVASETEDSQPVAATETSATAETNKPVVIDFFATWCGPCKALSPLLKKMESKYGDRIDFKRVDIDEEAVMAEHYNVEAVPTLVYISTDGTVTTSVGLLQEQELERHIQSLLK